MKAPEKPISFWGTLEGINSQFEFQILQVSKLVVSRHHQHCFLGKPTWAFLEGVHKQGAGDYWGTGLAQSWGMPQAKLSLCRIYFSTCGLWSLPCREDTAPAAVAQSTFSAPSSLAAPAPAAGGGGRVNYLQRNLLLFHCRHWGSNHRAATSKTIPLPPLLVNLWRLHSVHFFNADQRYWASADGTEICTPSARSQAPGALIPRQWVNFHPCSLSTYSK